MRAPRKTVHRARSLRQDLSLPEVLLWQALRRGQIDGLLFRRQHPVGSYVLDFYCPSAHLAIEIDGVAHDGLAQAAHDIRRDLWLSHRGIRVMRIPARDVLSIEGRLDVLASIAAAAASSTTLRVVPLLRYAEEDRRDADA